MRPLVIGYYTIDTPYEKEADVLKLSLDALKYRYEIEGVQNLGSWQKNTQHKAEYVARKLIEHPDIPLLYLDVDAIMISPPVILDTLDCDIAAVHFGKTTELLSGTVYFGPTGISRKVVAEWLALNKMYPDKLPDGRAAWDQRTLALAIKKVPECRFVELPQEYTWITELTQKECPGLAPVICHTRGAFRWKKLIKPSRGPSGPARTA